MNLRDLKPQQLKRLALEGEQEFDERTKSTNNWRQFSTLEPMTPKEIWRLAWSRGCSAVLRRVDKLRD